MRTPAGLNMKKISFTTKKSIEKKGYPTSSYHYPSAHEEADLAEENRYPKGYREMKKVDQTIPKGQLAGTHTRSGKIKISEKVPVSHRNEVALHEFVEWKANKRMCKKCKKTKSEH